MDHRRRLLAAAVTSLAVLLAGCSDGAEAPASTAAATPPSAAGSAEPADPASTALTAAACGEITRLSRESLDGLADQDPAHWEGFAIGLQAVANGVPDPGLREAVTAMATAALDASETLEAGKPLGPARTAFEDTVPAVDSYCKRARAPLN